MRPLTLLALCLLPVAAPAQNFCNQLRALTNDPSVAAAHWGVSVTTLEGTSLCGINQAQLFRPASNAKLFTAVTAIALLGPDHTTPTHLYTSSPASDPTTLTGDLTLAGTGSGFLSDRRMPYTPASQVPPNSPRPHNPLEDMADTLAATGLRHITGDIIGDDTAWPYEPYAPDWSLDDTTWGYGAPVSALSIVDNKLALTVNPGPAPGSPATATLDPAAPFYHLDTDVRTVPAKAQASLGIDRAPGSRNVRLFGTVALGAPHEEDLAIDDPAEYAAILLKQLLESRGITIDGTAHAMHRLSSITATYEEQENKPLPGGFNSHPAPNACTAPCRVLTSTSSPTLLDDVALTLKVSQNLHAELLLHQLGKTFADDGSTAQGARVVRQYLLTAGLPKSDFLLFDGSGLSGHDLVTPRSLTQLLVFAARQPWYPGFKAALPIGGTDGSLAARFNTRLKGRVFAKTGTLGESRALSGYVTAASGNTLVFSVLVDNHVPTGSADRALMDRIVETIAAQN